MIADWLERKEVCICAGSGGVGKTTTSAAIALGMAARGKKVAVLTIDPAKRLANALGLRELGNEERLVKADVEGELWAMMLDPKRTFDELVEWHAPDERTRDAVLSNRIYQELSNAVAGSQEYMAMEKLHELHQEGRYDLLVLDTPPTRNALDFLDAPSRLARFIDSRALGAFLRPGGRFLGRGSSLLFRAMQRITGVDVMRDVGEFFAAVADMTGGFRDRARRVESLLGAPATAFLLVTSPQPDSVEEATLFGRRLAERRMPFAGAIVNRVHLLPPDADGEVPRAELTELLGGELGGKVARTLADAERLSERDRRSVVQLAEGIGGAPLVLVPHLRDDIHDVAGLAAMNRHLFDGGLSP